MTELTGLLILVVFPLCMVFATCFDLLTMTIPNKINIALLAGFVVLAPLAGMTFGTFTSHLLVATIVLAVCYGLFQIGAMGGGDAKLLATSALWLGPSLVMTYLMIGAVLGGILTIVIILARRMPVPEPAMRVVWIDRLLDNRSGIPYGIALGPAALFVFSHSAWMTFASLGTPIG